MLFSLILSSNFNNVQILEIEEQSEMKKYMKSISKDLGVKCSHCHDLDDKSIDTPAKEISREMIKLTRYLNDVLNLVEKDHKDYRILVTCWTCHHGNLEPEHHRPND